MILSLAVLAGLVAGLIRAWIGKRHYRPITLRHLWLLAASVVPQVIAFYLPATRRKIPDPIAAAMLVSSQVSLAIFAMLNLTQPGMELAGTGAGLNVAVIAANGGWMPISPETVRKLWHDIPEGVIQPNVRLGWTKDFIKTEDSTHLAFLSDRFVISFLKNRYALSLGDLAIALGVFRLLWTLGGSKNS